MQLDTPLDLFAGPGGWDEGVRALGIEPLGVEWDDDACATRAAAGHPTLQADVAELDPREFEGTELLASPPCQAFSQAGSKKGRADRGAIALAMAGLAYGHDYRAELGELAHDPRSMLTVEPLRFALELRPRFIAFEQVPPVLPLWEAMAFWLRRAGYSTWTGRVYAEEYGVPQTRRRAILLASLDGPVAPPTPTHHRYDPRVPREALGPELLPWVSMAEALGWDEDEVARRSSGTDTRGSDPLNLKRWDWPMHRPATTIAGDSRVFQPGGHHVTGQQSSNAIRLTSEESGTLQTFPADYHGRGHGRPARSR